MPIRILSVVGARPNFMKIAPFIRAIAAHNAGAGPQTLIEHKLVHTGQHYDANMSDRFFSTLGIPEPDVHLEIGSGTHAEQVGRTMIAIEKTFRGWRPDWAVVVGDVNATCAVSITAKKEGIRLAHIEAGLRSFDWGMPEEINRMVTDRLSDLLLTPDRFADENLRREGAPAAAIRPVGNIMIDTLDVHCREAAKLDVASILRNSLIPGQDRDRLLQSFADGSAGNFAALTLHRPSNVDDPATITRLLSFFTDELCALMPVIWTIHPRTRRQVEQLGLSGRLAACQRLLLVEPLDYLEMLKLNMTAAVILTDSGGLQEECCVLGTPCITLRRNTERPVTLEEHGGVSRLVGNDIDALRRAVREMASRPRKPFRPPLWDGATAPRIVAEIVAAQARAGG